MTFDALKAKEFESFIGSQNRQARGFPCSQFLSYFKLQLSSFRNINALDRRLQRRQNRLLTILLICLLSFVSSKVPLLKGKRFCSTRCRFNLYHKQRLQQIEVDFRIS